MLEAKRELAEKTIGQMFRKRRRAAGLSMAYLAERLGVAQNTLYLWEKDKSTPPLTAAMDLADYYGITLDSLVGRDLFGGGDGLDWQKAAIDDLRNYRSMKRGVANNKDRIEALEDRMEMLRCGWSDATPVKGGTSGAEDKLINAIAEKERLELNIRAVEPLLAIVDKALQSLSEDERYILERFYVDRHKGYISRLCDEFGYEERQIYRLKDQALRKFTIAMYGITEL